MSKKTILISLASLTLIVTGLAVGLNLVSQNQNIEKKAASPTGTATFKMTPASPTLWTGSTQTVSGVLNLPEPILAYQIVAYLSYTTADPPALISATSVTTTEPALNCFTNTISLDSIAKKYTLVIACGSPATTPPTTYTTNGIDKTMFTFNLQANTPGTLTLTIDPVNSIVNSSIDASDILAIPTGGSFTVQNDTTPPPLSPISPLLIPV